MEITKPFVTVIVEKSSTVTVPVAAEHTAVTVPDSRVITVGYASAAGVSGESAYEIAVRNGFKYSEQKWLASLKGEPFEYEDFTQEQLEALAVKQPPLNPAPADIFNIAFEG